MKKYEYIVSRNVNGAEISWKCATREEARASKKELKQAGYDAKIIQTVYQKVSCQEVR